MAQFIYYRDLDQEKGPLDEKTILELYNAAEFTSDVTFQIRASETDEAAPFICLRDLISRNGPSNPFGQDYAELDKKIEEAEKELAELRAIASKKAALEKRVAEIERMIDGRADTASGAAPSSSGAAPSSSGAKTTASSSMTNLLAKYPGLKVEAFSMDNPTHARVLRQGLATSEESQPLTTCLSCGLTLANLKQALLHSVHACPKGIPEEQRKQFEPDFERWKQEDASRLSMGRRLFSSLTSDEKGCARPQTDFIEDVNGRIKKDMVLGKDAGRARAMEFLDSEPAKKMRERFEKHLREAKGKLVCTRCQVACKTHIHFLIHLMTYDHRMAVKGTPFELISLLLGWFNRDLYLAVAHESEMDESVEPDPLQTLMMDQMRLNGESLIQAKTVRDPTESADRRDEETGGAEPEWDCPPRGGELTPMEMMNKQALLQQLAQMTIISCTECNAMYTNFTQFLVHIGSEQHVGNIRKVSQSREEREHDQKGHAEMLRFFYVELQKWRWADRSALAAGKKTWAGWSEEEKRAARPSEEFIKELNRTVGRTIKKKANGKYEEYFLVAERYFVSNEAKGLMNGLEKHLKEAKMFACAPCQFGCKDTKSLLIHCMTYDHVRVTQGSIYELPTILIGVQKKDLVV